MKKSIFLFFAAILCAIGANAKTIYLNAGGSGLWDQTGALFVAEISGSKYSMTKVTGSYYEADVPDAATTVKFLRNDPSTGNTWNNTENLTIPDGKNCYTITGWSYGNWSTYTYDPLATDVYLAGSMNGWSTTANEFRKANAGDANGTISMILEAGSYELKVVRNGTWTSHNGTFSSSVSGKTFSSSVSNNAKMTTTIHGEYTFTWAISSSKLSITYPTLCTITANANDVAMGSVTGAGEFGTGLTATLTAITNDGYVFVNWTKGGEIVSTDATYSFKVTETVDLVANFEEAAEEVHNVTISYRCNETTVKENGIVAVGVTTTQEVTAPTVTGYQFTNWTIGAGMTLKTGAVTDATIGVVTKSASSDYTLVANYEEVMETVYFINTGKWSVVNLHRWGGTAAGTSWPGEAMTKTGEKIGEYDVYSFTAQQGAFANVIFTNKNTGSDQTDDLTWTAGKYYIYKYGNKTGWYTQAEAEELLVVIPDYYITGTIAGGWNGNEVKMTYSGDIWSHTFSASALTIGTEYKLKVTDGTWDNHWGTINGTIPGVSNDGDGNVCFKLSTVGDVTVTFDGAKITVSTTGTFYVPMVYDYYIVGSMNSWNQTDENYGMSKVGETTTYSKVLDLGAGTYEFKVKQNGGEWYGEYEGDYQEVNYKDGNIQIVLTAATNVTIKFDSNTKKISFEGLTAVTYSDITIKAYTESAAPQIWWWDGGSKCPDADKTDNPSNPGNKYTWETAPTMTAVAGEANWYEYTFKDVNDVTGICFKFKSGDKSSSDFKNVKENKCYDARDIVNAKPTECGVTPSDCLECSGIYLKGTFNSWGTDHEFMKTADADVVTTTVTITQEGSYNFKVHDTDWLGNDGGTMKRGGTGVETGGWTMEKDRNEVTLAADMEGDYIFTYTISTKKLAITFPVVVPQSFPNQPTTLYFHPSSEWKKGNERYAAYIYNNGADNEWINLTDANSDGIYELANPQKYAKVIICRMDKTKAENNWENKWDQIESGIEIPNTATLNTCLAFWTNCQGDVPTSECTWVAPTPLTDANWSDFVTAYKDKTINAVVERSFKSGQYHTLCLPFDIPTNWLGEGTEAYQLTSIVANITDDKLSLNATKWNTIVAGQPYIIVPVKGSEYEHVIINGVTVKNVSAGTNVASGDGYKATLKAVTTTDGTKTNGSTEYYVGANDGKLYNVQTNKLGLRAIIELTTTGGQPLPPKVRAFVATGENVETGVDNIVTTDAPVKVIENGQLIIIREGVKYNVQGQKL